MEPPPDLASLSLADVARLVAEKRLPPVEQWNPTHCGDSDMSGTPVACKKRFQRARDELLKTKLAGTSGEWFWVSGQGDMLRIASA